MNIIEQSARKRAMKCSYGFRSSDWSANQNERFDTNFFYCTENLQKRTENGVYFFLQAGSPGSTDELCPDCDPGGPH